MCLWMGSRKLSAAKTSAGSFLALLLKPDRFCGPILRRPSAGPCFDKALAAPFGSQ